MKSKTTEGTPNRRQAAGVAAVVYAGEPEGFSGQQMLSRANILAAFERGLPGRVDA